VLKHLAWTMLAIAGCSSSSNQNTVDAHTTDGAKAIDGATTDANPDLCTSYTTSTIASMRQGTVTGCFELDNVVTLGTTPSTKSPQVFVQDAGGGDFSALLTKCSSTSTTHPCAVAATVAGLADGHSVTLKGTYIKTHSTTFEEFFIDSVTDNGAGTAPASATATLAQIERGGTAANLRFQHVTVTISATDTLQMYDWTPSEFADSAATACPFQFGFGMIPKSVTATKGAACTNATSQPPGQLSPNPAEVLIGTDFFDGFTVSSDCQCAKKFSDTEPVAASTLVGTVSGLLVFDVPFGGTVGYYFLDPKTLTEAPISGTVAGM
jgi:hypothetical protein